MCTYINTHTSTGSDLFYFSYRLNTQLTTLPAEIVQLTALTQLYLWRNQLTTLPAEIGQLTALTRLDLGNNQLTTLPGWLRDLAHLKLLYLHDNPALQLSPSVLGPDPRMNRGERNVSATSILDFYFVRQTGRTRPLNEVKLILVGRGGAGKTCTVRALRDLPFRDREESTPVSLCATGRWTDARESLSKLMSGTLPVR